MAKATTATRLTALESRLDEFGDQLARLIDAVERQASGPSGAYDAAADENGVPVTGPIGPQHVQEPFNESSGFWKTVPDLAASIGISERQFRAKYLELVPEWAIHKAARNKQYIYCRAALDVYAAEQIKAKSRTTGRGCEPRF